MKMLLLQTTAKTVLMNALRLVVFISFSFAGSASALAVQPSDDWQTHRLLHPTAHQRANERQGHVFIYDGLSGEVIDRAMDQGFDRIESMMFVDVKETKAETSKADTSKADSDNTAGDGRTNQTYGDDGCD